MELTDDDDRYLYARRTAAHNAAHALAAWAEGYRVRQVVLDDIACGCDAVEIDHGLTGFHGHVHAARAVERQCRILLAGQLAEAMFSPLPAQSRLAQRDLEQAIGLVQDLCGVEGPLVLTCLIEQTRSFLSEHSWSIALVADALLKRETLDETALDGILDSSEVIRPVSKFAG